MGEWVDVAAKVPPVTVAAPRGATINLFASPYDVPVEARGEYDEASNRFVIDLRYMTEGEPTIDRAEAPLLLSVGKRSGRIYRISIDVGATGISSVDLNVAVPKQFEATLDKRHRQFSEMPSANERAVQATLTSTPGIYAGA